MKNEITKPNGLNRRDFITQTALAGAGIAFGATLLSSFTSLDGNEEIIDIKSPRKIGSLTVSSLGLGCMSMVS